MRNMSLISKIMLIILLLSLLNGCADQKGKGILGKWVGDGHVAEIKKNNGSYIVSVNNFIENISSHAATLQEDGTLKIPDMQAMIQYLKESDTLMIKWGSHELQLKRWTPELEKEAKHNMNLLVIAEVMREVVGSQTEFLFEHNSSKALSSPDDILQTLGVNVSLFHDMPVQGASAWTVTSCDNVPSCKSISVMVTSAVDGAPGKLILTYDPQGRNSTFSGTIPIKYIEFINKNLK